MRVIFLDIDGVLTTHRTRYHSPDVECVQRLNRLTEESDAKIVVSSTWRHRGLQEMRRILRDWGVVAPVIGITPDLSRDSNGLLVSVERGKEIGAWLEEHQETGRFVILDDEDDMGDEIACLVKTDTETGFREEDYQKARTFLVFE